MHCGKLETSFFGVRVIPKRFREKGALNCSRLDRARGGADMSGVQKLGGTNIYDSVHIGMQLQRR